MKKHVTGRMIFIVVNDTQIHLFYIHVHTEIVY